MLLRLVGCVSLLLVYKVSKSDCFNSEYYNGSSAIDITQEDERCDSGPHESIEKVWPSEFTGKYPEARRENVEDDYHGMKIKDPYRWLENPHCEETQNFMLAQNNITYPYLRNHSDRSAIRSQLENMMNYEKYSSPQRQEDNYFYFHNTGLQNHSIMYIQKNLTAAPKVFLDPNKMSEDGTTALKLYAFTENGKQMAYCVSKAGSDWNTLHIRDVETGRDYPEVINQVKFPSVAWTHDNKGFFYNRYSTVEGPADGTEITQHVNQKLYYHYMGADPEKDPIVVEFPEHPTWAIHSEITDCGRYLLVSTTNNTQGGSLYYFDLHNLQNGTVLGKLPLNALVHDMNNQYEYVTNNGHELYLKTDKNAPNHKIITMDINNPKEEHWKTVVPEDKKDAMDAVAAVAHNKLMIHYLKDVKSQIYLHDLESGKRLAEIPFPTGQVATFAGRRKHTETFFTFTSFLEPCIIYHCNIPENISSPTVDPTVFRTTEVPEFNPTLFQTKQVFYQSKDGTRVPMYIINRVGLLKNRNQPVIIYGYGGYGVSLLPTFSVSRAMFLRHFNGIYCIPSIRGGGEYGEKWHEGGRIMNKQNVFDDFQYAAKYLIDHKYTNPKRIAIMGGSNGGLLMGACLNQRPDLYGAVIILVGALDMLRFNQFTIAYYSESEFGSPKNKTQFYNLLSYSPLHNIRPPVNGTQYPATLVCTADHDDRVPPLHSYKFIAELQHQIGSLPQQKNHLLLRVEENAGHGQGTPLQKQIDEMTDYYVFLMKALRMKYWPYMD